MRFLLVVLFTLVGFAVGMAAAVAVVATCSAVHRQEWPQNGSPDWTAWAGMVLLVLGPLVGAIVGFVVALRRGRGPH